MHIYIYMYACMCDLSFYIIDTLWVPHLHCPKSPLHHRGVAKILAIPRCPQGSVEKLRDESPAFSRGLPEFRVFLHKFGGRKCLLKAKI